MYVIYVDMDGVLVDLASSVEKTLNIEMHSTYRHSTERHPRIHERLVKLYQTNTSIGVFRDAEQLPDATHLWEYINQHEVEVLSSTGPMFAARIEYEKRLWLNKHKGKYKANFVRETYQKARFAKPNHILIDDQERALNPWRSAGGIGILHVCAETTIQQLKELGL